MAYCLDPLCYTPGTLLIGNYLLKNKSKYSCLLIADCFLIIWAWIRVLINKSFIFVFISNILKGLATPLLVNLVTKTSNDWFPAN